jgi:hypothetical protein
MPTVIAPVPVLSVQSVWGVKGTATPGISDIDHSKRIENDGVFNGDVIDEFLTDAERVYDQPAVEETD